LVPEAPVSAPTNITSVNVTETSAVLRWTPVPPEAARGFLLGYTLHYQEYGQANASKKSEKSKLTSS